MLLRQNDPKMVVLLVDDRDGRILAAVETADEAQAVPEAWARDDGILGTDTSVRVPPLQGS